MLSLGVRDTASADYRLPTVVIRVCRACGAGHFTEGASVCRGCERSLDDAEIIRNTYRIENVATQPAERITANDEERQRQGFDLQTTFEWAERGGRLDVRRGHSCDALGTIARLSYGPGATIIRLNKGLRRRANRSQLGFMIDSVSGYWARNNDDDDEAAEDPTASPRQWIVPSVRDRKNALLLLPAADDVTETTLATVQHALLRGIESVFQLEQGEVFAEPVPTREARRGVLLYEASEGGAGVLTRLVTDDAMLATIARAALRIMHFKILDGDAALPTVESLETVAGTQCVAGCYKCLLSYYNQPDHDVIDRRDGAAKEMLLRLGASTSVLLAPAPKNGGPRPKGDAKRFDGPSESHVHRWLDAVAERALPSPDAEALRINGTVLELVWRSHYVAALLEDTSPVDVAALQDRGFVIVPFGADESEWPNAFGTLEAALGL